MAEPHITAEQLIIPAPDPGVVALTGKYLEASSKVLDAGCGIGRNAIHLAHSGHDVIGVDENPEYVQESRRWAKAVGMTTLRLSFIEGDITQPLFEPASFKAVLLTRVLQMMKDRRQVQQALTQLQTVTANGGHHLVTAYVGNASERNLKRHLTILKPGEIGELYAERGWAILHHAEEIRPIKYLSDGTSIVSSYDEIVAQKPADPILENPPSPNVNQLSLEYWRRADPEYYEYLKQQC
jgi:ubiquinone/menaquinone biosynthesis C-methylase UbiE